MATITVSEETAERFHSVADEMGIDPEELLLELLGDRGSIPLPSPILSAEDIDSIRRGLEDSDAGRVIDGKTLFAELDAHIELLRRDRESRRE